MAAVSLADCQQVFTMASEDPTILNLPSNKQALPARAGKYTIVGRIGQGGMGVVYRAVDDDLGRTVALKFLPPDSDDSSHAEQRFLREARAASALDHVNIGTIFGVEETEDRRRFIVMAYYEGQNLSERIEDEAHPLSPSEALSVAIQVARGLAEAHAHGITHRDIKPSNILLTPHGPVKIVDFGLASKSGAQQLTQAGATIGTPAYMSPEQALGEHADHRTDIWSLAVVLVEMLTRQRAFRADTVPGVLYKVVHGNLPLLENVPQPFRAILAKALEKEPANRYQSVNDFLAALEAVDPGTINNRSDAVVTAVTGMAPSHGAGMMRRRGLLAASILLIGVLAGAAYLASFQLQKFTRVKQLPGGSPAAPSVFDKYMQAGELMKRWDKEGNLERAIMLLTDTTKTDPTFALGFARLAEAQRVRYALVRDKSILESATRSAEVAMRLNPELAPVQVAWGRVQATGGKSDIAIASFERALRIDPNDADAQLAIARQYERLGRLADAEAAFKKAGSLDPESISAHDFYANFLFRQGRHADAIVEWRTVIQISPDNAAALVNLGAAFIESGRLDEAVSTLESAQKLKPSQMGYANLGTAYARAQRYPEAVASYRKALEQAGNNYMVWGNLAGVYARMKELNGQAKQTYLHAIEIGEQSRKDNPRDAVVQKSLAEYYARTGNTMLARQRMDAALALSPRSPDIQATAAEVYELLGQRQQAIVFAKRSLELGFLRQRFQYSPELSILMPHLR